MKSFLCSIVLVLSIAVAVQGQSCKNPRNQIGNCIPLFECQSLVQTLRKKPLPAEDRQFLAQSQCGWNGRYPKVCCADQAGTPQPPQPTPSPPAPASLLPRPGSRACGLDTGDRIYGGNATKIDEYPWLALIEYTHGDGSKGFHCGGVLINENHVLTASHCVNSKGLPTTWTLSGVRLGEWDLESEVDCDPTGDGSDCSEPPQDIPVVERIPHEGYDPNGSQEYNDIALLRLGQKAKLNYFVRPICLPSTQELRAKTAVANEKFIVAGWGKTETRSQSNIKLKVDVNGVDYPKCNEVYAKQRRTIIDKQICAGGAKGKDSCRGDSGGPLMAAYNDGKGNAFTYLAGLVSYGPSPCGLAGWPGVYTRVASYIDWIESKVKP